MSDKIAKIGDAVVFCDPMGNDHEALITANHGNTPISCVNLVWVSDNEAETDTYGRQIKRESSCQHQGPSTAHGNYFRFSDEERLR